MLSAPSLSNRFVFKLYLSPTIRPCPSEPRGRRCVREGVGRAWYCNLGLSTSSDDLPTVLLLPARSACEAGCACVRNGTRTGGITRRPAALTTTTTTTPTKQQGTEGPLGTRLWRIIRVDRRAVDCATRCLPAYFAGDCLPLFMEGTQLRDRDEKAGRNNRRKSAFLPRPLRRICTRNSAPQARERSTGHGRHSGGGELSPHVLGQVFGKHVLHGRALRVNLRSTGNVARERVS